MRTSRYKLLFILLAIALFTIVSTQSSHAAEITAPENLGGRFSPYALPDFSKVPIWIAPLAGMAAGLLSAAVGTGGGFMVVPTLMTYGVAGIYAVGAEMFRIFIFTLVQSFRLILRKKIRYLFSGVLSIGTAIGGFAGLAASSAIYMSSPALSNLLISLVIVMWLITYAFIIVPDFKESADKYAELKNKKNARNDLSSKERADIEAMNRISEEEKKTDSDKKDEKDEKEVIESFESHQIKEEPWDIAVKIRSLPIPPYLHFPSSIPLIKNKYELQEQSLKPDEKNNLKKKNERISIWPVFLFSMAGGFFMALTGSGGLIFGFTIFTRAFACLSDAMIGADFARIALSSGALTIGGFGLKGFVSFYNVSGLILGSVAGVHIGGHAMEYIKPHRVKGLLSLTLVSVIINRFLILPNDLRIAGADISSKLCDILNQSSKYILLLGILITAVWFLTELILGIHSKLAGAEKDEVKNG